MVSIVSGGRINRVNEYIEQYPIMCRLVEFAQVFLTLKKEIISTFPSQYSKNDIISKFHYFEKIRFSQWVFEKYTARRILGYRQTMKLAIKNIQVNLYIKAFQIWSFKSVLDFLYLFTISGCSSNEIFFN